MRIKGDVCQVLGAVPSMYKEPQKGLINKLKII